MAYLTNPQRRGHDLMMDTPWAVGLRIKPTLIAVESLCCRDGLFLGEAGGVHCFSCSKEVPVPGELAATYWPHEHELAALEALVSSTFNPLEAVLLADALLEEVRALRTKFLWEEEDPWVI